jgi:hypothetical protein
MVRRSPTKPCGALLFRKDLEHEGAVLKSGNKRIVTVNLWAIDQPSSSDMKLGVLLISFPPPLQPRSIIPETASTLNISSSVNDDGPDFSRYFKTNDIKEKITPVLNPESKKQKLSAGTELRSLSKSDQSQTYALKVSTILAGPHKDSFFGGFVRFSEHSNHHSDDDNSSTTTATVVTPLIIRYECKVGTYEQFKVAPPVPIALTLDSFMWAYCENGLKHVQEVRI